MSEMDTPEPRRKTNWSLVVSVFSAIFAFASAVAAFLALRPILDPPPPICDARFTAIQEAEADILRIAGENDALGARVDNARGTIERADARLERLEGFLREFNVQGQMRALARSLTRVLEDFEESDGSDADQEAFNDGIIDAGWPDGRTERRRLRRLFEEVTSFDGQPFYQLFDFGLQPNGALRALIVELERAGNEVGPFAGRMWDIGVGDERIENGKGEIEIAELRQDRANAQTTLFQLELEISQRNSALFALETQVASLRAGFEDLGCAGSS